MLYFPNLPFRLPNSEKEFLDGRLTDGKAKNISLDHTSGKLQGTSATRRTSRAAGGDDRALRRRRHALRQGSAAQLCRRGAGAHQFRPVEVEGRALFGDPGRPAAACRCLSVAADAEWPAHPALLRQCRAATAMAARGTGRWASNFEDFAAKFAPRLRPHLPGKSWLFEKLGVTRGRRSAYDEMMLSLHDAAKRDAHYQKTAPHTALEFPPGILLAGLYRPGAACGAGGRIRAGADFPFRCRGDGRAGAGADPGAGTPDGKALA